MLLQHRQVGWSAPSGSLIAAAEAAAAHALPGTTEKELARVRRVARPDHRCSVVLDPHCGRVRRGFPAMLPDRAPE